MSSSLNRPILVAKFGGTSLSNIERIQKTADRILKLREKGYAIVVVVSAMGGETNRLLGLGLEIGPAVGQEGQREFDALISTGEQVSASLMAMALQKIGVRSCSLNASQISVHAESCFQKARIKSIDLDILRERIHKDQVVVVTGFQGIDKMGNTVTLGRGGSDTTAVAFAVALDAARCEIYTDVAGVYTADPRIFPNAKKLSRIFFEEMLELASSGANVLQIRCVELAMKNNIEIHLRSSFLEGEGTLVVNEIKDMEGLLVTGIAHDDGQAKLSIIGLENRSNILALVLEPIAKANISIDLITQNLGRDGKMTVSFTLNETDLEEVQACIHSDFSKLNSAEVIVEKELVKISVVGIGMRTHAGVAQKVFQILSNKQIPILMGLSTEIKVSCILPKQYRNIAVSLLHEAFHLDEVDGDDDYKSDNLGTD